MRQEYPFLNLTAFGVVVGCLMHQLTAHSVFVHIFSSRQYYSIDGRRDLLSMYLPQEAHKSSTAALSFLGGVVNRPATVAVENGSQIADRHSIICFGENKKGLDSAFSHFVKTTKTESETLDSICCRETRYLPVFRPIFTPKFFLVRVQIQPEA